MHGRRLRATALGLLALALAACGSPAESSSNDPSAAAPRTVEHAMGTTEITGTPQRVVVLDTGELDTVLALGVTPVGAVTAAADDKLQSYLGDRTRDIKIVGTIGEPNLEAIAALKPDLILSNKVRHEALYPALTQIAPTVFAEKVGVAWRENLELAGTALGRSEQAAQALADYRSKATETGKRFGDPAAVTVSMVRFNSGTVRLYGRGSFIGTVLADAGFARPAAQQVDKTFVEVSPEQIAQADADLLFYGAFGDGGRSDQSKVVGGPLWPGIPAVAAGRAHEVSDDLWYLGIGPIAAGQVLDELAEYAPQSGQAKPAA
ncbi:iron-siderophore ABC transporter substrate-binding protein [Pseudonocardia sp. H11422]|uniref:ABC transporter substrate-binding protein n=1 Tax=Pseudonocardia sp. H11422 TaxID=2835866 RepID=UPI0027E31D9F|nr:iron-siderophore ABC transporter substrate-binding protein [Pseudonocardia sp. H11422]